MKIKSCLFLGKIDVKTQAYNAALDGGKTITSRGRSDWAKNRTGS